MNHGEHGEHGGKNLCDLCVLCESKEKRLTHPPPPSLRRTRRRKGLKARRETSMDASSSHVGSEKDAVAEGKRHAAGPAGLL